MGKNIRMKLVDIALPNLITRQHPAGRVARSADSRSSYSVPLEPQSTVHKLFNIPPIYLDWTLSNQPPAKIEPRRHETQPSRRHETQPSRRPSSPTVGTHSSSRAGIYHETFKIP